jgi:hypothetical protein
MDADYFATFAPSHCEPYSAGLFVERRTACSTPHPPLKVRFEIVIVGFDYLAQFSIFCGLLSAFGSISARAISFLFKTVTVFKGRRCFPRRAKTGRSI